MHGTSGEPGTLMPDLTGLPLDDILATSDTALVNALRRAVAGVAGAEPPVSAYDSGAQLIPPLPGAAENADG